MTQHEQPDWFTELIDTQAPTEVLRQTASPGAPEALPAPPRRRWRRWRGLIIALVATGLVLAVAGTYVHLTLTAPVGTADATFSRPDVARPPGATIALPQIGESAVSISGAEDYLGQRRPEYSPPAAATAPFPWPVSASSSPPWSC